MICNECWADLPDYNQALCDWCASKDARAGARALGMIGVCFWMIEVSKLIDDLFDAAYDGSNTAKLGERSAALVGFQ